MIHRGLESRDTAWTHGPSINHEVFITRRNIENDKKLRGL